MSTTYPQTRSQWLTAKTFPCVLPLFIAACSHRVDDCNYTLTCGEFSGGGTVSSSDTAVNTGGIVATGGTSGSGLGGTSGLGGSSALGGISSVSETGGTGDISSSGGGGTGGTGVVGVSGDNGGTGELISGSGGTGGGSDTGATGGSGDSSIGGATSAVGGISGLGGIGGTGDPGGGGTGGVFITCSPLCQGQKPVCLQSSLTCVQCTGNEHCSSPKPYCDTFTFTCAECLGDAQCSGIKPHCDLAKDTCVECAGDSQCSGTKPHCDLAKNACVECTGDTQCSGSKPYCDLVQNTCVECLESTDCTSASASVCLAGKCGPCATNNDCLHIGGKGVCDTTFVEPDAGTESGTCVECTGNDYAACSSGDAGPAQVCDSLHRTCTDIDERSATVCEPCVSDAQCQAGKLCVEEKFGGVSVGYFCFFNQDYAINGTTQSCASLVPYVKYINGAVSIDGKTANICGLQASTCTAMSLYRKQSCAPTGAPNDSLCGVAPGVDSKCLPWASGSSSSYYCTVACVTSVDCKNGLPCKPLTDSTKSYCAFQ